MMAARETIVVFDSGLGGLTVYREIAAVRPNADFIYVADDAAFPYGAMDEQKLVERVVALIGELIATHRPDLIVIACNTASTIALPALRKNFTVPFVGTVPAIKPACAGSVTKRVSVLGTEATVAREYTRALIRDYAGDCQVTLVGSKNLAAYAEAELAGAPAADAAITAEIAPCFCDGTARTDTVVLACTHYPLIIERLQAACAVAGQLYRPGAGDRPARRRSAGPGAGGPAGRHDARHLHLRVVRRRLRLRGSASVPSRREAGAG